MNEVEQYYDHNAQAEWGRLDRHRTEFAVTLRALGEFLPRPPASVLDCGGGPGRYAIALTQQNYQVTLLDLAQANLDLAEEKAAEAGVRLAGILHGDARHLETIAESSFDAVLLLGPLYHLLAAEDRLRAIRQAHRVLKSGGVLFAAFISRFAPLRDVARRSPEWIVDHQEYAERIFASGIQYRTDGFTEVYLAHPTEIVPILEGAGFAMLKMIGCEGVVAGHEEKINALTGEAWEVWTDLNYRLGQDPALLGAADHLLYVGQKPT